MNRLVKAAVAVTAFGLGAALAVPAQAEVQYNTARHAPADGLGEGASVAGSPLGGLLGGLPLLGGLLGGSQPKSGAAPSRPSGEMTEAERDAAIEMQERRRTGGPNAAEDVTREGGPLPELSPILGGVPLGGGGLTESLPVGVGASRMAHPAKPSVKAVEQSEGLAVKDTFTSVGGLVESYVQGAVGKLPGAGLLPDSAAGVTNPGTAATGTMRETAKGMEALSSETMLAGLAKAARHALPATANTELSPVVGQVAPSEMAPVMEALPGTTQTASMDELTPLVEEAAGAVYSKGTKATGSYSDLMTALGWTADALTSSVRGTWARS
ncbi:hypothetical protein [Nonomuraea sp. SYSU D8015]|uniref:hypothetical protein n=1 Tax=Nonomuraea sp. SYSU D8015 TaxID=2593644 RepID=UPI001660FDDB|nr:hypothetical protein [Nonomuraea sp. SYSU D8015]